MAVELIAGLGLFKSMFDAAKGLKDINDAAVRNAEIGRASCRERV